MIRTTQKGVSKQDGGENTRCLDPYKTNCRSAMPREITDVTEIEEGDIIGKGMQEFEVTDVQPKPDGFGPPFKATAEPQKDLGEFSGGQETFGEGDLLGGYKFLE